MVKLYTYSIMPFGIILVGHICIIVKVVASEKTARMRIVQSNSTDAHTNARGFRLVTGVLPPVQTTSAKIFTIAPPGNLGRSEEQTTGPASITAMLLTLNAVFFVCTFPIVAFFITRSLIHPYSSLAVEAKMLLFEAISEMFMYTNHAVNFFLYFLSGSNFRRETKALLRFQNRQERDDEIAVHRTGKSIQVGAVITNVEPMPGQSCSQNEDQSVPMTIRSLTISTDVEPFRGQSSSQKNMINQYP
jgi:hypothetical protein